MSTWTREAGVAPEEMVQPEDLGEAVRFLLRTSPTCLVREIEFTPPAQREIIDRLAAWRGRAAASARPDPARRADERRAPCAQRTAVRAKHATLAPNGRKALPLTAPSLRSDRPSP